MIEAIAFISGVLAVTGVIFNNHKMRVCFPVWIVSNIMAGVVHYDSGVMMMLWRDVAFTMLAVHGWRTWGKNGSEQ